MLGTDERKMVVIYILVLLAREREREIVLPGRILRLSKMNREEEHIIAI